MDNQHRMIKGYRELTEGEIEMMNQIKVHGEEIGALVKILKGVEEYDQRWVSIGATHLQQGIMALVRAITKPETF